MPPELSWPSPTLHSSLQYEVQIEIDSRSFRSCLQRLEQNPLRGLEPPRQLLWNPDLAQ